MAAAVPVFKLATLLVRTLAKPIANRIKSQAQGHPRFSGVTQSIGNTWHAITQRIYVRLQGHVVKSIKPLPPEQAIALGAELIGESFVYSVSASVIVLEYQRQQRGNEEKAKEKEMRRLTKEQLRNQRYETVERQCQQMFEAIQTLESRVEYIESVVNKKNQQQKANGVIAPSLERNHIPPWYKYTSLLGIVMY